MAEMIVPTLKPGRMCYWYKGADVHEENRFVAIVHRDWGRGQLWLIVLHPNGGGTFCVKNVRHVKDPMLAKSVTIRRDEGCWDYADRADAPINPDLFYTTPAEKEVVDKKPESKPTKELVGAGAGGK